MEGMGGAASGLCGVCTVYIICRMPGTSHWCATITWKHVDEFMAKVESFPNGVKHVEKKDIGSSGMGAYGLTKTFLNSYTMALVGSGEPNLKVNSCSPRMIVTDLVGSFLPWLVPLPIVLLKFLIVKFMGCWQETDLPTFKIYESWGREIHPFSAPVRVQWENKLWIYVQF
eukprot:scaffold88095_cov64-Attheya_sp.AAC.1